MHPMLRPILATTLLAATLIVVRPAFVEAADGVAASADQAPATVATIGLPAARLTAPLGEGDVAVSGFSGVHLAGQSPPAFRSRSPAPPNRRRLPLLQPQLS